MTIEELNKEYEEALTSVNDIMADMRVKIKGFMKQQKKEKEQINIPNQQYMIDNYGENAQSRLAMEECGELIQAINKMSRERFESGAYFLAKNNLREEIADVLIMIEQLKLIYHIKNEDIQPFVDYKQERQLERIEEENEG